MPPSKKPVLKPVAEWTLPAAATLGSSVRAKGVLLEIRARLPGPVKKFLDIRGAVLILSWPEHANGDPNAVSRIVRSTLEGIEAMPVIPREIQDILAITTTERHRWLKDGRLQSAGTRTVKLRGRAKKDHLSCVRSAPCRGRARPRPGLAMARGRHRSAR